MIQNPKSKKRIPYWLALIVGTLVTCVVMNIITISFQLGVFNPWTSIKSPPSGAVKIIDANYREIWVETNNGQIFTTCIYGPESDNCAEWKLIKDASEIPEQQFPITRASDCKGLRDGTNPNGQIVECVYANFPGPEMGEETYFALMADSSLKYWGNGASIIATQIFFGLSTIVLPFFVAVLISVVYLIMYIVRRIKQNKEGISGQVAG